MDNLTKLNLLYDYYGDFLTSKQREIFELYYVHDLSLGEIAEQSGITRQGVYDVVRRSQKALKGFEKKLGMVNKHFAMEKKLKKILVALKEIEPGVTDEYRRNFYHILDEVTKLLEGSG